MAASLIQSTAGYTGSGTTVTAQFGTSFSNGTQNTTAGNLLVVYFGVSPGGRTLSAADNVNGAYNVDSAFTSSASILSFPNCGGGAVTITGTASGAAISLWMIAEEWNGPISVAPFDKGASNSGGAATTGTTGTTTTLATSSDLALAMLFTVSSSQTSAFAISSPFTASTSSPWFQGVNINLAAGNQQLSSATGISATFTWPNSSTYRACIATYKTGIVQAPTMGLFSAVLP